MAAAPRLPAACSASRPTPISRCGRALSFNGGTLQVTGTAFNTTARAVNWSAAGGHLRYRAAGNSFTVTSVDRAGGALTKIGAGHARAAGATSYRGATSVSAGTLQAGRRQRVLARRARSPCASGRDAQPRGHNQTIGSLAGSGRGAVRRRGVLTTGGRQQQHDLRGHRVRQRRPDQGGHGTLIQSGTNTYTGTTTVNAGTLSVNGAIAGPSRSTAARRSAAPARSAPPR
jgi:autotransporter-associated beta strand protein